MAPNNGAMRKRTRECATRSKANPFLSLSTPGAAGTPHGHMRRDAAPSRRTRFVEVDAGIDQSDDITSTHRSACDCGWHCDRDSNHSDDRIRPRI